MEKNKNWYAVYTKPKWEKKVADLLGRKKIENYCPLNKVLKQWSDRKKFVEEPLFSSYVFIHATESEHVSIKQTDGVINFVYWLGRPAIIKASEIETIKDFLTEHQNVKLEKISIRVSDMVRVTSGPLMMMEGEVLEVGKRTIKVALPSLGYAMVADVQTSQVEVLGKDRQMKTPRIPSYNNRPFNGTYG